MRPFTTEFQLHLSPQAMDQMRVLDQLAKRCRSLEARIADMQPLAMVAREARGHVAELEHRLREAEDAAAAAVAARRYSSGITAWEWENHPIMGN